MNNWQRGSYHYTVKPGVKPSELGPEFFHNARLVPRGFAHDIGELQTITSELRKEKIEWCEDPYLGWVGRDSEGWILYQAMPNGQGGA